MVSIIGLLRQLGKPNMPINNPQDAYEVRNQIELIFAAGSTADRLERIRQLFVGILDFRDTFDFSVGLDGARGNVKLPTEAHLVARLDDVQVVYVDMSSTEIETNRVNREEAQEAARLIAAELGDDLMLVFTNRNCDHLHFVYPSFEGRRPALRRMVAEKGLPRRTLVQQISNIWEKWRLSGDIRAELASAFDVEAVTKRFFAEYKKVFDAAKEKITGFGDDEEERDRKNLFVQTLFNRLMFVYFISRKGWLKFDGNYEYLDVVWKDYDGDPVQDNFYDARLMPLFFEGLNNPFNREVTSIDPKLRSLIGSVPFLNGGLFEKTVLDEREGVVVPDGAIRPILSQLFDRFNFTVMESTPLDVEVAVDPEMLGKVFEETVNERHESGSYYTPRPVVSFMCREALKGYLNACVDAADEATIGRFVDEHSTKGIQINAARQIAAALESITVVDPACGSGAYLLGMMQELIELQTTLFRIGVNSKELYELKLQIIRDNLYGVDNDEFAVNITMLRLWLSLAIDYTETRPEPLPNLEFKIVRGDSLLGPDPSPENLGELSSHWIRDLKVVELKSKYMYAHDPKEKLRLRGRIDSTQEKIRQAFQDAALPENVVDWRVEFAEVFTDAGGFDVVVANPPFVNSVEMERKDSEYRETLRSKFATAKGAFDIFVPFIERGIQLMSRSGILAYITPNKLLSAQYAKDSRDYVLKQTQLMSIIDMSYVKVFDASVYPVVTVVRKRSSDQFENEIDIFSADENRSPRDYIDFERKARLSDTLAFTDSWSPLLSVDAMQLFSVFKECPRFVDVAQINGAASVKEAYEWKDALIDQGHSLRRSNANRYRRFIVSGNIRRYYQTWSIKGVQYLKHRYIQPVLDTHHSSISNNRRMQIGSPKIIVSGLSKRLTCIPDLDGLAAGKSTVLIFPSNDYDIMFLCGLLNSDLMNRLYHAMYGSLSLSGGYLRFGPPQLKTLPIPQVALTDQQVVADLERQRLGAEENEGFEIENRIEIALADMLGINECVLEFVDHKRQEYIENYKHCARDV